MTCISKRQKLFTLSTLLLTLFGTGTVFYAYQNTGSLPGGNIALSKIFWLGYIIFFWFLAPILLLLNGVSNTVDKWLISLHLSNVWLRASIELFMMYHYQNWQPTYGILHDVFSMLLLLTLVIILYRKLSHFIKYFLLVIAATFAVEATFAQYMLNQVIDLNNPIFFVPESSEHQSIFTATWLALILLSLYFMFFAKKWYGSKHD